MATFSLPQIEDLIKTYESSLEEDLKQGVRDEIVAMLPRMYRIRAELLAANAEAPNPALSNVAREIELEKRMGETGDAEVFVYSDEQGKITVRIPWNRGEIVYDKSTIYGRILTYTRDLTKGTKFREMDVLGLTNLVGFRSYCTFIRAAIEIKKIECQRSNLKYPGFGIGDVFSGKVIKKDRKVLFEIAISYVLNPANQKKH